MSIRRTVLFMMLMLGALLALSGLAALADWAPQSQESLLVNRVYAYRGWQSTGIQLHTGDWYALRAEGTWLYSPFAGPNGPEGHRRFLAPNFYPLPNVGGGALIGRVGEDGPPFYVGKGMSGRVERNGLLYLRIDDDLLGDNVGNVTIQVTVTSPTPKGK